MNMTIDSIKRVALWLVAGVLVAGCAAGTNVKRPAPGTLAPGKTTYQDVISRYGKPWGEGTGSVNERTVKELMYVYVQLGGEPHASDIEPARGLNLWFEGNVLIGYEFRSSFEMDHTDFDESQVEEIEKGKTDKAAVIRVFGQPTGELIHPMLEAENHVALVYSYLQTNPYTPGPGKTLNKRLLVELDENSIVREVEYVVSETE